MNINSNNKFNAKKRRKIDKNGLKISKNSNFEENRDFEENQFLISNSNSSNSASTSESDTEFFYNNSKNTVEDPNTETKNNESCTPHTEEFQPKIILASNFKPKKILVGL